MKPGDQHRMTGRKAKFIDTDGDLYPTPPQATRALLDRIYLAAGGRVWEPAAGKGHICDVIRRDRPDKKMLASDIIVRDRSSQLPEFEQLDFLDDMQRVAYVARHKITARDYIITNPPYQLAMDFVLSALDTPCSVAMFVRLSFLESKARYDQIFAGENRPNQIFLFSERVSGIEQGRLNADMSSMVCYVWMIWHDERDMTGDDPSQLTWIPPRQIKKLQYEDLPLYDKNWHYGSNPKTKSYF